MNETAMPPAGGAAVDESEEDANAVWKRWEEQREREYASLRHNARAVWKAMEKWRTVRDADEWAARYVKAHEDYASGEWLLEEMGGEFYLDPDETAVFLGLRQALREGKTAAAEDMIADLALISYRNAIRVQGWIGNAALYIEHELFGQDSPTAKLRKQYGVAEGLRVEDTVERLVHELVPLFDRCNRAVLRNLQALKALRDPATPTVAITSAGQVNVGAQQTNTVQAPGTAEVEQEPAEGRGRRLRPVSA